MAEFLTDIKTLRERARQKIEEGPITSAYGADRERVIEVLNEALATEIVCYLRYKRHYFTSRGIHSQAVAAEFLQHATEEQGHADQIALRITQLQGEPNFDPEGLASRSHAEYDDSDTIREMLTKISSPSASRSSRTARSSAGSATTTSPPAACWRRSSPWRRSTPTTCSTSSTKPSTRPLRLVCKAGRRSVLLVTSVERARRRRRP